MPENKELCGFLNIYKEKGMTSFDVCNKIKHLLHIKKVGHSGTLDPNATGVMQVALGKATKLLPILEDHKKIYEATIKFGLITDTLDPEGKILKTEEVPSFSFQDIDNAINELKKQTMQIPPIYSAIKVEGKKLYEYAREGKEVELKPRPIKIYEAYRTSDFFIEDGYKCIKILLTVSKGFYVRSFVNDLASRLNTIAIMSDLVRISIANYHIKDAILLKDLVESNIISVEDTFNYLKRLDVKEYLVKLIKNGITLDQRQIETDKPFLVYFNNELLAIYEPFAKYKYKIVQYFGS